MALIQINVDDNIKIKADKAFERVGISTPMAMKMMVTQIANTNRTPFDNLFFNNTSIEFAENIKKDMIYAEAQEYGLLKDDADIADEEYIIPNNVLKMLGLSRKDITK